MKVQFFKEGKPAFKYYIFTSFSWDLVNVFLESLSKCTQIYFQVNVNAKWESMKQPQTMWSKMWQYGRSGIISRVSHLQFFWYLCCFRQGFMSVTLRNTNNIGLIWFMSISSSDFGLLCCTAVRALVWNNSTLLCKIDFNRNLSF